MQLVGGYNLPDYDHHMSVEFRKGDGFQLSRLRDMLKHVPGRGMAVDGGAHVGSWAIEMAKNFWGVVAFEPHPENFECLKANVEAMLPNTTKIHCVSLGLSDVPGTMGIEIDSRHEGNSGGVFLSGSGNVAITTIDDWLDGYKSSASVDFIKLDVEGFELRAIKGAAHTIATHRPMVMVECKDRLLQRQGHSVDMLLSHIHGLGGREVFRAGADRLFSFR